MNRTKHLFITLLAFVVATQLTTNNATAQSLGTWVAQTSGTTNELRSVYFTSEMEGWAAGANATLLKTTNGGTSWTTITNTGVDSANGFTTIRLTNANTVWVGGRGAVARSTDAGATWMAASMPTTVLSASNVFYNVYFPLSNTEFWAAGGGQSGSSSSGPTALFVLSANGALTRDFSIAYGGSGPDQQLLDAYFLGLNNGWLIGPDGIKRLAPVGTTGILPRFQSSPTSERLYAIYMLNNNLGWIVGSKGTVLKTTNSGDQWTLQTSGVTTDLRDVHFIDANRGWAVGDGGLILASSDGGSTWVREVTGITTDLRSVYFANASVGYIVGANGAILRRLDNAAAISVSAASYVAGVAAEAIASAFGTTLATMTQSAASMTLPTTLAGTTVKVKDSAGDTRDAPLFYVSPTQINYLLPADTKPGLATVTVTNGNGGRALGATEVFTLAPSFFAANQDGKGAPAGFAIHVKPNGEQTREPLSLLEATTMKQVPKPIDLGPENEMVILELYGTGLRKRSAQSAVTATIGGVAATVDYADKHAMYVGLDQVNLKVPRALSGRGEVDVIVSVDGKVANTLRVHFR